MRSETTAYLLYHWRDEDDDGTAKLIGVFSSREAAEDAKETLSSKPGFRDDPDAFMIDEYPVDRVHWSEGFAQVEPEASQGRGLGVVRHRS